MFELVMLLGFLSAEMSLLCSPPSSVNIVGLAKDVKTGEPLYCEWHRSAEAGDAYQVEYLDVGGNVFATKTLTFTQKSPHSPNVLQKDFRSGEERVVSRDNDEFLLNYRSSSNVKLRTERLRSQDVDVVDAGFNTFVIAHWEVLLKGNAKSIQFASAPHLRSLPLQIRRKPLEKCNHDNSNDICFWVELDNMLLRRFIGKLKLTYDSDKRLRYFEGVVNIRDKQEKSQKALIHYRYREKLGN